MARSFRVAGEIVGEMIRDATPGLHTRFRAEALDREDEKRIRAARKLATDVFVRLGKIDPEKVGEDGLLINDHLLPVSTFFAVYNNREDDGEPVATCRLLWTPESTVEDYRLPLEQIDPEKANILTDQPIGTVAELASLAKKPGASPMTTIWLMRRVWDYAKAHGIDLLECGLEPKVYSYFREIFAGAIEPLTGHTVEFPGIHGQQQPLVIYVKEGAQRQKEISRHEPIARRASRFAIRSFIGGQESGQLQNRTPASY